MARWLTLSNKIEDDRGVRHAVRAVWLESPSRLSFRGTTFTAFEPEQMASLEARGVVVARRVLRHGSLGRRRALLQWTVILSAGGAILGLALAFGEGALALVPCAMCPLLLVAMVMLARSDRTVLDRKQLGDLPRCCLACTYNLEGVNAAADGCVVCPECGAAWKFPIAMTLR